MGAQAKMKIFYLASSAIISQIFARPNQNATDANNTTAQKLLINQNNTETTTKKTNSLSTDSAFCDPDWKSSTNTTCDMYAARNFCTPFAEYGTGWRSRWGSFKDWSVDEKDATACPQCGCEEPEEDEEGQESEESEESEPVAFKKDQRFWGNWFNPGNWFQDIWKAIEKAANAAAKEAEKIANAAAKEAEKIANEVKRNIKIGVIYALENLTQEAVQSADAIFNFSSKKDLCAILYQHSNFGGRPYRFFKKNPFSNSVAWFGWSRNDYFSSVLVMPHCSFTGFEHGNYGGNS